MPAQTQPLPSAGVSPIHDCWNKIGVYGEGSCAELKEHAHCRNCPVYSAAAVRLLDRDLPPLYISEWTTHFAKTAVSVEQNTHSALLFRIGSDWLGLTATILDEVAEVRTIRPLPHRRTGIVLGLVNVRGELIVCVSLGKFLGLAEPAANNQSRSEALARLVVLHDEGLRMAFPVDEVHSTLHYDPRQLSAPPATLSKAAANRTTGVLNWNNRLVACLDGHAVVSDLGRSIS